MKATIDIPDDLYRRVAAESARQGRPVDAVVADLIQRSLDDAYDARLSQEHAHDQSGTPTKTRRQLAQEWLDEWLRMGEEAHRNAPPGPSAREILEEGRNRLEPR
jgi:hypothetical protein